MSSLSHFHSAIRGLVGLAIWLCFAHAISAADEAATSRAPQAAKPFGIRVIDQATNRGVPLIALKMVDETIYYTDSAGWVAFDEPDLWDQEVFFQISGPGYEYPADGFGYRGVRVVPRRGEQATIKVERTNIAERLYRITGRGIYRDSLLLGLPTPLDEQPIRGGVTGQDSVQAVPYRGQIFWLYGDTSLARYPLGNFRTTSALTPLPGEAYRPEESIPLEYLCQAKDPGRVREMVPSDQPGPIWLFGLFTIRDPAGEEALVSHYSRQKCLAEVAEHGLVRYRDDRGVFEKIATFPLEDAWRHPRGNAIEVREDDGLYLYFAESFAQTRVKATWEAITSPAAYEALAYDGKQQDYVWQRERPPTSQEEEEKLLASGAMPAKVARYRLADAATREPVTAHRSSIVWNAYRKTYVMITSEMGRAQSPSLLGELWYAEAEHPSGPWNRAVKIASHPRYTFYNPRQHAFFAADEGRTIYFEGTYTQSFSGNPVATPRYEYNQILYRLDLADPRLSLAQ